MNPSSLIPKYIHSQVQIRTQSQHGENTIHVVNVATHIPTHRDVSIMRSSPLGNPFSWKPSKYATYKVNTREDAITRYSDYIEYRIDRGDIEILQELKNILTLLDEFGSVNLVCCCSPMKCHGDIIKQIIITIINYESNPSNP